MTTMTPDRLLHDWNGLPAHLASVRIEDDTLRDGLQGAFVRRPSVPEKIELLDLAAAIGVQHVMLGFPASSSQEFADCRALLRAIEDRHLSVRPRFLARAEPKDLEAIAALNAESGLDVDADFFIGASRLRRYVEGWDFDRILKRLAVAGDFLASRQTSFGVSIEDATRTFPEDLRALLDVVHDIGARWVTICDTVGEVVPAGVARITEHVLDRLARHRRPVDVSWHGHNDKGFALANAVTAATCGARVISGTFLGIGERAGNTPLEQVIFYLRQSGSPHYRLDHIPDYCRRLAEYTRSPVPDSAPLVGRQAFATCTGTHAAAIVKARSLGPEFEDLVFSGVPARALGRRQEIFIGPTSGQANVRDVLRQLDLPCTEDSARRLLDHAKTHDRWLTSADVRALVGAPAHAGGA